MICKRLLLSIMIVTGLIFSTDPQKANADEPLVLISAFAPGEKGAIHAYKLNPETGELKLVQRNTDVEHPFFSLFHPTISTCTRYMHRGNLVVKIMNLLPHMKCWVALVN